MPSAARMIAIIVLVGAVSGAAQESVPTERDPREELTSNLAEMALIRLRMTQEARRPAKDMNAAAIVGLLDSQRTIEGYFACTSSLAVILDLKLKMRCTEDQRAVLEIARAWGFAAVAASGGASLVFSEDSISKLPSNYAEQAREIAPLVRRNAVLVKQLADRLEREHEQVGK